MKTCQIGTRFGFPFSVPLSVLVPLAMLIWMLTNSSCRDSQEPMIEECCPWCVGPAGGQVEITDPENPMVGVKVVIPPGAWDDCRALSIEEKYVYAPPFPNGFHPYHRYDMAFGIQAGGNVPDSLYMEIYLPLNNLTYDSGEVLCAFYYDELAERWRIIMPDEIVDGFAVVKAHLFHYRWSWGIVALAEVDWDQDLEPLMEDLEGEDQWEGRKRELAQLYERIIKDDMELSCANLDLVHSFCSELQSETSMNLINFQNDLGHTCGVCDVTTLGFYDGYLAYMEKNIEYFFVELFFFENGPNLLIQAYGFMRLCEIMEEIDHLDCDYKCFFSHTDEEFTSNHIAFCVATVIVEIIEYAEVSGYFNCG